MKKALLFLVLFIAPWIVLAGGSVEMSEPENISIPVSKGNEYCIELTSAEYGIGFILLDKPLAYDIKFILDERVDYLCRNESAYIIQALTELCSDDIRVVSEYEESQLVDLSLYLYDDELKFAGDCPFFSYYSIDVYDLYTLCELGFHKKINWQELFYSLGYDTDEEQLDIVFVNEELANEMFKPDTDNGTDKPDEYEL